MDSPLTILARRATTAGYEPWLFYRDGLDWRWRSWEQVADHVMRGVETLRALSTEPRRAGYRAQQDPDAITVGLAIQAAGWVAVPVDGGPRQAQAVGCNTWISVGTPESSIPGVETVELPKVLSAIDRTQPRPLVLDSETTTGSTPATRQVLAADLLASARRLDPQLPAGQPIVCAAPSLSIDDARLLEVWSLVRGAPVVLEPHASAFTEAVLWARPNLVWAHAAELEALGARLKDRKHQRRSRIAAVVVTGEGIDPGPWQALGIRAVSLETAL